MNKVHINRHLFVDSQDASHARNWRIWTPANAKVGPHWKSERVFCWLCYEPRRKITPLTIDNPSTPDAKKEKRRQGFQISHPLDVEWEISVQECSVDTVDFQRPPKLERSKTIEQWCFVHLDQKLTRAWFTLDKNKSAKSKNNIKLNNST